MHTPGQHPALARMRPAQDRAYAILNAVHGTVDVDAPAPTSTTDRDTLEYAYRMGARELLDHDTRIWLEWTEQAQVLAAYGQTPLTPEPTTPERLTELHELVTLAHTVQTGPVRPQAPADT